MKRMSFAARVRDTEWKLKRGYSVLNPGRRIGQKSSSASAPQPSALPGDHNGAAAASKLPASASPSGAALSSAGQCAAAPKEGSANLA